ncbi:MAG: ATP-binding protein [Prevotellaceae bacterium]|jgi:DNA transposition AAA+ family ATPase|nr:ATP-binding protein [Prevotellaceae bacterium]
MNQNQKKQIIAALEEWMQRHGVSQNEVSKRAGVNAAYLVAIRKGEYSVLVNGKTVEIADKHFERVAELIGFSFQKSEWETRPTEQLMEVLASLEDAKAATCVRTIIGDTGCGKSYTVELFRRKYPNDVFVVTVSQLDNVSDILEKVVDLLGIPSGKGKSRKMNAVVEKMRSLKFEGKTPLIIFDECEYMKQPALCAMKELYDRLCSENNRYCGIALVGHYQLLRNMERFKKQGKDGIPQFFRRVKFGVRNLPNIDRRFDLFFQGIEDKHLRRFLSENCENYGELHDVLVPALREAERTGEELTENFVKKVLNFK